MLKYTYIVLVSINAIYTFRIPIYTQISFRFYICLELRIYTPIVNYCESSNSLLELRHQRLDSVTDAPLRPKAHQIHQLKQLLFLCVTQLKQIQRTKYIENVKNKMKQNMYDISALIIQMKYRFQAVISLVCHLLFRLATVRFALSYCLCLAYCV